MTAHPGGKIQATLTPMLPATCVACRKSANGVTKFLDFQADVDYYGAIVICEDCAREMLDVLGFVPVALVESLRDRLEIQKIELNTVREENERLRGAFDSILVVRPDIDVPVCMDDEGSNESIDSGASES